MLGFVTKKLPVIKLSSRKAPIFWEPIFSPKKVTLVTNGDLLLFWSAAFTEWIGL
jgi:hypothetical protein